jgi:hypothetical protein
MGPCVHRKNILIYIQQDVTLHILFYLETALHVLGGTTTHHQERKQLYLQHLVFVTPGAVDTVVCDPDDGWWYYPKHVEQFPDKINCVTLHLVGYILEGRDYDSAFTKEQQTFNLNPLMQYSVVLLVKVC